MRRSEKSSRKRLIETAELFHGVSRKIRLPREKNAYKSQLRGRNDYRLAQITTRPARMSTAAMPMARLIAWP